MQRYEIFYCSAETQQSIVGCSRFIAKCEQAFMGKNNFTKFSKIKICCTLYKVVLIGIIVNQLYLVFQTFNIN